MTKVSIDSEKLKCIKCGKIMLEAKDLVTAENVRLYCSQCQIEIEIVSKNS